MVVLDDDHELAGVPSAGDDGPALGGTAPPPGGWQTDKAGRQYVKAEGRRGIIYRSGEETVSEAIARDQLPRDQKRPSRKGKTPPKAGPPPKRVDLKELELMIAEALKAPAIPAAAFGDEWAASHFTQWGPYLARNLVAASETNPWLRRKLENAANGGDMMMQVMSLVGVAGAGAMYILPPLVWWLNLPIPEKGRQMLGVPERTPDGGQEDPTATYSTAGA